MAAIVVDGSLKSSNWTKKKPADYKGKDLDNALKAYEALADKKITVPAALPTMPKHSASAMEQCIKDMQAAIAEMQKATTHLKQMATSLQKVSTAGNATANELRKLAEDKQGADKKSYLDGASTASAIALEASQMAKQVQ